MEDFDNSERGFYWTNKSWYALSSDNPCIYFGMYPIDIDKEAEISGEIKVEWENFGEVISPCLTIQDDSFRLLTLFSDVFTILQEYDNLNMTEEDFIFVLKKQGFTDRTKYSKS